MPYEISLQVALLIFIASYAISALFMLALSYIYLVAVTPQDRDIDRLTKLRGLFPSI